MLNIFVLNNFFGKTSIFQGNYKKLFRGVFSHFLGKWGFLRKKLIPTFFTVN